jgi:proline iminopeptidase
VKPCAPGSQIESTIGDVHGDFKAETHVGESRCCPLHRGSPGGWHGMCQQTTYISATLSAATLRNINAMLNPLPTRSIRALPGPANPRWPQAQSLAIGSGTRMSYRAVGSIEGQPWLVLHGGPGSGCHPGLLQDFDPARHWAIAPDQRGSGSSTPRGSTLANTTSRLVADLELLRLSLGISSWSILAGSWGTVLALHYAQAHPGAVEQVLMRGAFGLRRAEIEGVLLRQSKNHATGKLPRHWPKASYANAASVLLRLEQVLQFGAPSVAARDVIRFWSIREISVATQGQWRASRHLAHSPDQALTNQARAAWASMHRQQRQALGRVRQPGIRSSDRQAWQKFRLQAHYLRHRGYTRPVDLSRAALSLAAQAIPSTWIHGRFDAVCPPANSRRSVELIKAQPGSGVQGYWPSAGHLGTEPGIRQTLQKCLGTQRQVAL